MSPLQAVPVPTVELMAIPEQPLFSLELVSWLLLAEEVEEALATLLSAPGAPLVVEEANGATEEMLLIPPTVRLVRPLLLLLVAVLALAAGQATLAAWHGMAAEAEGTITL